MFEFAGGGARAPIETESRGASAPAGRPTFHPTMRSLAMAQVWLTQRKPVDIREKQAGGVKCI
jgi:hypothetical protein